MELICEHMSKKYFPTIRQKLAHYLFYGMGYKQEEIAELLGITQAAVSQYLKNARGRTKKIVFFEEIEKMIPRIAQDLTKNSSNPRRFSYLCEFCEVIKSHLNHKEVFIPEKCKK
ncbi:MAG: hypothetical protein GXN99_01485 [Candidatus Nanohaloarchaeota archaeon]|nr:hypothetical protein [Candidatus Nanohaloarchaeota archaeon]